MNAVALSTAFRPAIPPVPAGVARPLWSVMIPTYDCAHHLRETLVRVLAQDPGPDAMQIEVVDDHSTRDAPEDVVREVGETVGAEHPLAGIGLSAGEMFDRVPVLEEHRVDQDLGTLKRRILRFSETHPLGRVPGLRHHLGWLDRPVLVAGGPDS